MRYQTYNLNLVEFEVLTGERLENVNACYTLYGSLESNKKTALFFHGFSSSSELHIWWSGLNFDEVLEKYNIICINSLGSSHGTTGPQSMASFSSNKVSSRFPDITVQDMVNFTLEVLKELKINSVDLVFGCSLGGMQVLDMYLRYPNASKKFVSVAGVPVPRITKLMNLAQARLIDSAILNEITSIETALGISRIFFRLSCTTEDALSELESKLILNKADESYDALHGYFINDSLKFQKEFSPLSNSLFLKLISRYDISDLYLKRAADSHIASCLHLVSISSDTFTPVDSVECVYRVLQSANYNVKCYEFGSKFGHEAWIVDGKEFYEFSKNNNLF